MTVLEFVESLKKETKDSRKRHEHDLTEVNNIFSMLSVDAEILDLKRLGKDTSEQKQPPTITAKVANEWQKRKILLSL